MTVSVALATLAVHDFNPLPTVCRMGTFFSSDDVNSLLSVTFGDAYK